MIENVAIWFVAAVATAGVVIRPFRSHEWIWAMGGAMFLVATGLIPVSLAALSALRGMDVYLFLTGMMLLSETARDNGLFDWIATHAVNRASGSGTRLFTLVYLAGIVVTIFMSNDATAVVLTPAVCAAARRAKAEPLPMLFACALIANAASFVLPVSNPANLVLYGGQLPPLAAWLRSFALPSVLAIAITYFALLLLSRRQLAPSCEMEVDAAPLTSGGKAAFMAILLTAVLLVTLSAFDCALGLPTALAGIATTLVIAWLSKRSPVKLVRDMSWGFLPLVGGLFVLVGAIDHTGLVGQIASCLRDAVSRDQAVAALGAGSLLAFLSNVMNNLPAGLIASEAVLQAHAPRLVVDNLLIGVDLGPNLSITGSLATIFWLQVIRREGQEVTFLQFLRYGAIIMPLSLVGALGSRLVLG